MQPFDPATSAYYLLEVGSSRGAEGTIVFRRPISTTSQEFRSETVMTYRWARSAGLVFEKAGREYLRVRRQRWVPPRYELTIGDEIVGRVVPRVMLKNRYVVSFSTGLEWIIRTKLYSVHFTGHSNHGARLAIIVGPSKRQWNVAIDRAADDPMTIAALGFIHWEWYWHA